LYSIKNLKYGLGSEADAEEAAAKVRELWKLGVDPIANVTAPPEPSDVNGPERNLFLNLTRN
jgi:hypothetical protein